MPDRQSIQFLVLDAVCLGAKKPYYVRDYLSPKHIRDHGLAEILEAMEVADRNNDNRKKQLLSYLWPHTDQNFSVTFQLFKRKKLGLENEDKKLGLENEDEKTGLC